MMQQLRRTTFSSVLIFFIRVACLQRVAGYSQISLSGNSNNNTPTDEGPKIFKAMNFDLIFPQTFNASENVISTTIRAPAITMPSSWPSNPNPAIFVTPATEQEVRTTAPDNSEATSLVTESHDDEAAVMSSNQQEEQQQQQLAMQENKEEDMQIKDQQQEQLSELPQPQLSQQHVYASTGRAVDHRRRYPFGQLITPLRTSGAASATAPFYGTRQRQRPPPQSRLAQLVYPSGYRNSYPLQRAPSRGQTVDRFSPSEGVVSHQLKNQQHNHNQQHHHSDALKTSASSNQISSYVPPKELYSFPPNIDAKYPSPAQDPHAVASPTSSITSYKPPPSGPLTNNAGYPLASNSGYHYSAGPINPSYIFPPSTTEKSKQPIMNSEAMDAAANQAGDTDDDSIGVLPASAMDTGDSSDADIADMTHADDDMSDDGPQQQPGHPPLTGYDSDKEYPTPPPGWLEEHPEENHDEPPSDDHLHDDSHAHDEGPPQDHHHVHHPEVITYDDGGHHHHHHHPLIHHTPAAFPVYRHPYPEIIYDDHFDHHHHLHHRPEPVVNLTTEPPPPPPPPEARVKKYSYFYIGRKLWYIPLYFTVWFSFYVLWLILKSIARHKVNLPNHYVSRRSLPDDLTHKTSEDIINKLTISVLRSIDSFQEKYL